MRRCLFLSLVVLLTTLNPIPAWAGGSWLEPNGIRVEAGDHLVLEGGVSIGQLGWVEDGPYFAYLTGMDYGLPIVEGFGGSQTDVLLGLVDISHVTKVGAFVSVEITIPDDAPPGEYWVTICNDPCTGGFGDLIGSQLFVGMDPVFEEPGAAALPSSPTTEEPSERQSPDPITTDEPVLTQPTMNPPETSPAAAPADPVLVGGAVLLVLLLAGGLFRVLRPSRPRPGEPERVLVNR